MKRGLVVSVLVMLGLATLVAAWVSFAGTGYQQDCKSIYVDGVKCTGCSRCYEPRRVGADDSGKIAPWEFRGEGWSEAEKAIGHISISSQLIVNGVPVATDFAEEDNSSYVHTSGYATGGDWWECVYTSHHVFKVVRSGSVDTEAGWSSKGE